MLCWTKRSNRLEQTKGRAASPLLPLLKKMKLSHYIKKYTFEEKPGHLLLYSTKKTSMVLLKEETYNAIQENTLSPKNKATLSELGMIVNDTQEEKKEVLGLLDHINKNDRRLRISVILNLECNFSCVYCYEGDLKGKHYMSEEIAGLLIDFIKSKATPDKKYIKIDFYGGEPLLSLDLIKSISKEIKSFSESRGIEFSFTLVTNASLFKRRIAEELVSIGLTGIKTTIDGPPDIHNKCRPFRNGGESFDNIINNLKETIDLINVRIGGNYQKGNYERFPELIDCLENEGLTPDKVYQLKFDAVMNHPQNEKAPSDYIDGLMSLNEPWVIQSSTLLREEVMKRGYSIPKLQPTPCQVEIKDAFVVNYDGSIYKCPVFVGRKKYEIGDLRSGTSDYSETYRIGNWKNSECEECVYFPLCFGGCRYMSYVRDGHIDNVDCKKTFLDSTLESIIKQDIKYRRYVEQAHSHI